MLFLAEYLNFVNYITPNKIFALKLFNIITGHLYQRALSDNMKRHTTSLALCFYVLVAGIIKIYIIDG